MMNFFTPEETQDQSNKKEIKKAPAVTEYKPSPLVLQVVFGYASALTILKTKSLGNIEILLN